jgi:hypothetical protein
MTPTDRDDQEIAASHLELEQRIRQRAQEIYEQRGGGEGSALDDWLQAEREVLGTGEQPAQDRGTVVGSAKTPDIVFE